jgi:hypothetical protein
MLINILVADIVCLFDGIILVVGPCHQILHTGKILKGLSIGSKLGDFYLSVISIILA